MEKEILSFDDLISELKMEKIIFSNLDNNQAKINTQERINKLEQKIGQYILANNDLVSKLTGRIDSVESNLNNKLDTFESNLRDVNKVLSSLPKNLQNLENHFAVEVKNVNNNYHMLSEKIMFQEKTTDELFKSYYSNKKSNLFDNNSINNLISFFLFGISIFIIGFIAIFLLLR